MWRPNTNWIADFAKSVLLKGKASLNNDYQPGVMNSDLVLRNS